LDLAFWPQARGWLSVLFGIRGWLSGLARSSFLSALAVTAWAGFSDQAWWFRGWLSFFTLGASSRGWLSEPGFGTGWLGTCLGLRLACSAFFRGLRLASQLDRHQGFQRWPAGPTLGSVCWTSLSGPKLGAGFRDSSAFGACFRGSSVRAFFRRSLSKPGLGYRPRLAGFGAGFLSSRSGPALGAGSWGWLAWHLFGAAPGLLRFLSRLEAG
jgi:hypothetical protein